MRIVGVTFSDVALNRRWAEEEGFQYEIWKDVDKTLALHFRAASGPGQAFPDRVTRVLDAEGRLVVVYDDVRVGTSPGLVLEDCRVLFGQGP